MEPMYLYATPAQVKQWHEYQEKCVRKLSDNDIENKPDNTQSNKERKGRFLKHAARL